MKPKHKLPESYTPLDSQKKQAISLLNAGGNLEVKNLLDNHENGSITFYDGGTGFDRGFIAVIKDQSGQEQYRVIYQEDVSPGRGFFNKDCVTVYKYGEGGDQTLIDPETRNYGLRNFYKEIYTNSYHTGTQDLYYKDSFIKY
ncbi:MAG: hypothetical protein UT34_C0002G0315 [candidate division WS6 bacterium GW2011_GWF2_39_15]|uniref:Uncharacterized protein n=1 Tax=candidate division WS6 bacterium GW2011_GWF2_39_15 TaxID=1619100 RepID=A0A0G0MRL6_9BACT|nr:MAG: hypothetical protein UT34_C0002G0315 [candidate division WS6 bacterium GW2011_GWF2_39_15]